VLFSTSPGLKLARQVDIRSQKELCNARRK
jgi:hypothetical protein